VALATLVSRALLRATLSLPAPVLQMLSGGGAEREGVRELDPRFQFLAHAARRYPSITSLSPKMARLAAARGVAVVAGRGEPGVRFKAFNIDAPQGPLRARVYRSRRLDPQAPVLVYFHGGGGVVGDLATSHAFCTILAKIGRCSVLSVDYRLAPEHPYPAAVDDALFAVRWARRNAERFGAAAGRIAVGGDSFGAMLAAVAAQDLKRLGEAQPDVQLLLYPAVDVTTPTQSMTTFADAYPLSSKMIDWFRDLYAPGGSEDEPRLSPLKASDLTGLAPAIVVTAGFDPLVDQGEIYAHRLLEAGVPSLYRCYERLPHGFVNFTGAVPAADIACREVAGIFRQGLEGLLPAAAALTPHA
jgi:acetyl esterase/lipase